MPSAIGAAYLRLTVLAPHTRVDLALPVDMAVAELIPMVLELIGDPGFGRRPQPWRLHGVVGGVLPPDRSLRELGVLDGEVLRIAQAGSGPAPPIFDDPVDALAATAGDPRAGNQRFRVVGALLMITASAGLLIGWPPPALTSALLGPQDGLPGAASGVTSALAAAAAVAALARAAWLARRPGRIVPGLDPAGPASTDHPDPSTAADTGPDAGPGPSTDPAGPPAEAPASEAHPTDGNGDPAPGNLRPIHTPLSAVTAAVAAVPLATVAGWTALPTATDPTRLVLAAAAAGLSAAVALMAAQVLVAALVAVVTAAVPIGVAALAVLRWGVPPTAAAVAAGALTLAAGPLLPRIALALSGWPRPLVPADAAELMAADDGEDLLPATELAERAALARGYLAGLVGGCTTVAGAAALPAATVDGWTGPAFAAVTIGLLVLRARSFADAGPARSAAASALAAAIGLAVVLGCAPGPWSRVAAATGLLLAAAAVIGTIGRTAATGSPVRRRAVDLAEGLLTAIVVPLALAVMDLYRLVRGL